jgi:hypothetical protein
MHGPRGPPRGVRVVGTQSPGGTTVLKGHVGKRSTVDRPPLRVSLML